ncbi:MAG: PilN domain-containing protein [Pseudomonadota bacterium]
MTTSTKNFKETIARLSQKLVGSRFMRWWLGELNGMKPAWLRANSVSAESFMLVPLAQVTAQFAPQDEGDKRDVALTLPPARILGKTLSLPLATEENLRQVLEFQMEQHTPFPATKVYFGYWVIERDFERGQLTVEFAATPREGVDAAIKILGSLARPVRAVFASDMLAAGRLVNLLPEGLGKAPSAFRQGANPWLAALVGLLAVTAMAVPLAIKREAVVQMLPWVEKAKSAAGTVDATRRELENRVDQHNYLLQKRRNLPTVIQSLEELTRILPDGTWAQSIDIRDKEVQVQGETDASVKLIGLFEQSSMFRDASFRSPLTKVNTNSSNERYHLALQMRPEVAAVPASGVASAPAIPLQGASAPASAASTAASATQPVLASSAPAPKASDSKNAAPKEGSKP